MIGGYEAASPDQRFGSRHSRRARSLPWRSTTALRTDRGGRGILTGADRVPIRDIAPAAPRDNPARRPSAGDRWFGGSLRQRRHAQRRVRCRRRRCREAGEAGCAYPPRLFRGGGPGRGRGGDCDRLRRHGDHPRRRGNAHRTRSCSCPGGTGGRDYRVARCRPSSIQHRARPHARPRGSRRSAAGANNRRRDGGIARPGGGAARPPPADPAHPSFGSRDSRRKRA